MKEFDEESLDNSSSSSKKEEFEDPDLEYHSLEEKSAVLITKPRAPRRASIGGKWSPEEDQLLREIVNKNGGKNWKKIASELGDTRTDVQCLHRWNKVLKPGLNKGNWSNEEDAIVRHMVTTHGVGNIKWSSISQALPGRIGKQCRERWFNHLDPSIKRSEWTSDEDVILYEFQKHFGNRWKEMAKMLPGRTENSVKNRWNSCAIRNWMKDRNLIPGNGSCPPHLNDKSSMMIALQHFQNSLNKAGVTLEVDISSDAVIDDLFENVKKNPFAFKNKNNKNNNNNHNHHNEDNEEEDNEEEDNEDSNNSDNNNNNHYSNDGEDHHRHPHLSSNNNNNNKETTTTPSKQTRTTTTTSPSGNNNNKKNKSNNNKSVADEMAAEELVEILNQLKKVSPSSSNNNRMMIGSSPMNNPIVANHLNNLANLRKKQKFVKSPNNKTTSITSTSTSTGLGGDNNRSSKRNKTNISSSSDDKNPHPLHPHPSQPFHVPTIPSFTGFTNNHPPTSTSTKRSPSWKSSRMSYGIGMGPPPHPNPPPPFPPGPSSSTSTSGLKKPPRPSHPSSHPSSHEKEKPYSLPKSPSSIALTKLNDRLSTIMSQTTTSSSEVNNDDDDDDDFEDEDVSLDCLTYFKYLGEPAKKNLMKQLIGRFQRTSFTPRHHALLNTPVVPRLPPHPHPPPPLPHLMNTNNNNESSLLINECMVQLQTTSLYGTSTDPYSLYSNQLLGSIDTLDANMFEMSDFDYFVEQNQLFSSCDDGSIDDHDLQQQQQVLLGQHSLDENIMMEEDNNNNKIRNNRNHHLHSSNNRSGSKSTTTSSSSSLLLNPPLMDPHITPQGGGIGGPIKGVSLYDEAAIEAAVEIAMLMSINKNKTNAENLIKAIVTDNLTLLNTTAVAILSSQQNNNNNK